MLMMLLLFNIKASLLFYFYSKFTLGCPKMYQHSNWKLIICMWLSLCLKIHQQHSRVLGHICGMATIFAFTKEIPQNTKEYMPLDGFCSHFSLEGWIISIYSPDCYICIATSKNIHIIHLWCHIAIWPYRQMNMSPQMD